MTLTPPLLAAMTGAKPRPRREHIPAPYELDLVMPVAKLLREYVAPGWKWTHFPAGELRGTYDPVRNIYMRDVRTGTKLKQMGLQRGWPDFILGSPRAIMHGLECKRIGETLSEAQEEWRDWAILSLAPYEVCYTIDQVLLAFERWGCLRVQFEPRRDG